MEWLYFEFAFSVLLVRIQDGSVISLSKLEFDMGVLIFQKSDKQ